MLAMSRQRGVSLIEVLVAIVIFSVAALGVALMQLKGAQFTKQSGVRTVAVLQARSIADAMRANPAGVYGVPDTSGIKALNGDVSGSYYLYDGTKPPSTADCSDSSNIACTQAKRDLQAWLQQLQNGTSAPVSNGTTTPALATIQVSTDSSGTLAVAVSWSGLIPNQSGTPSDETYQFDFQPTLQLQP
jgi:type IV pilus assembly protein PilV